MSGNCACHKNSTKMTMAFLVMSEMWMHAWVCRRLGSQALRPHNLQRDIKAAGAETGKAKELQGSLDNFLEENEAAHKKHQEQWGKDIPAKMPGGFAGALASPYIYILRHKKRYT